MSESFSPFTDAPQPYEEPDAGPSLRDLLQVAYHPDELGVPAGIVVDLILKIMFNEGQVSLRRFGEIIKLHPQVVDTMVEQMQQEHLVEVAKAGAGRYSYLFKLTDNGAARARDAFDRSQYIGPAPVPIESYNQAILLQSLGGNNFRVQPAQVKAALSHLILPENFHRSIGPAINNGTSLFLYGPPGNGKTTIAEAVANILTGGDPIFLPYAVQTAGYVITLYDPVIHELADIDRRQAVEIYGDFDPRWALFKRPNVMVGGELTMDSLELRYEPTAKFYEAPLQMKANGGMFLIDDFGRQQVSPSELLNRWIVPLESQRDYLRLVTGQALEVPFRQLIIFSTNLDPSDLVDGAFMRRIQMKVGVHSPDLKMFYQIFRVMSTQLGVPFDEASFKHLIRKWYHEPGRTMQAVHPRDILKVVRALCEYESIEPRMTPELIDEACSNYFVAEDVNDISEF